MLRAVYLSLAWGDGPGRRPVSDSSDHVAGCRRRKEMPVVRTMKRLFLIAAILSTPVLAHAQEAVLTGTVADSTGGVLPGVTVTAIHEATGNRFETVTDERGIYRIPGRVGVYQVTAELQGFATTTRTGLQLLVGQTAVVNLQLVPSTVQETVTVSAATPL